MNDICDLYLPEPVISSEFKYLHIFDKSFSYQEGKEYRGYVGVKIKRIKMLSVIVRLREKNITAFSVLIEYRNANITKEKAFEIARARSHQK